MPRKRRLPHRRHRRLTFHDLWIGTILDFLCGWRPPVSEFDRSRSSWQTWPEFFADYEAVREEFLAWDAEKQAEQIAAWQLHPTGGRPRRRRVPFAERALAAWIECGRQASPAFGQRLCRADMATEKAFADRDDREAEEDLKAAEREDWEG